MKNDRFFLGMAAGAVLGGLIAAALTAAGQTGTQTGQKPPVPTDELRRFAEVFGSVKTNYVEPVDDRKAIRGCINGMLSSLDGRSEYLDEESFRDLRAPAKGLAGVGAEMIMENGLPKIISVLEGSPAGRAGLQSGDFLVRIEATPLAGKTRSEVFALLRGKPDSEVRVEALRPGAGAPFELKLRRENPWPITAKASMLEGGIVHLRLSRLSEDTADQLTAELSRLYREAEPKGVVLDLRGNPGGLLSAAVQVSAAFLPDGALVLTTDGRTEDSKRRFTASPVDYLRGMRDDFRRKLPAGARTAPLAVLVNGGSASGAEIIAGALKDHKRAVIVGEKTAGIGTIQTVYPLAGNTAVKVTTARWIMPSGQPIEGRGITPDLPVEVKPAPPGQGADPALAAAVAALKR